MNSKDIKHLANLSRLHLTDDEIDAYTKQFDEIVAYVDKIKEFSSNNEIPDQVGDDVPVNVMREDKVDSYPQPETIVNEAPEYQDNFVKVKKILNQ
ncbi:MAG: glutamyl-tRNA(Gln) amidotransferase, subunit [Candidatus Parcubacteria bacterium]|jgi:aspartyl-tRNA(Asn)/glutamyl-tRNA(Gln) amidotransferase subunit C